MFDSNCGVADSSLRFLVFPGSANGFIPFVGRSNSWRSIPKIRVAAESNLWFDDRCPLYGFVAEQLNFNFDFGQYGGGKK